MVNQAYLAHLHAQELRVLAGHRWWWRLRWAMVLNRLGGLVDLASEPKLGVPIQDLLYGETPVLTAWKILSDLGACSSDIVVDLGCGRGLIPIVASLALGIRAVGVDISPFRIRRARHLVEALQLTSVIVRQADYRREPLPEGSLYFLSPISLAEESWSDLQKVMRQSKGGSRAVVLCEPLEAEYWDTCSVQRYSYSWGIVKTYFQRRNEKENVEGPF
jgi:SAM-dependent methyltransferase